MGSDRYWSTGERTASQYSVLQKLSVLKCCFEENPFCTDKARKEEILFTLHVLLPILKLGRIVKTCRSMQEFFSRRLIRAKFFPSTNVFYFAQSTPSPPLPPHNVCVSNRPSLRPASTLLRIFCTDTLIWENWILDVNECQEKHLLKQHLSLELSSVLLCFPLTFSCNSHNNKQ